MAEFDRRLTPARPDLAAKALVGQVEAERFADPEPMQVIAASTPLRPKPDLQAALDTELILGEPFAVYERQNGWVWGQSGLDDYVGYLPEDSVGSGVSPTHRVKTLATQCYTRPSLKLPPIRTLPHGARLAIDETEDGYGRSASGWVPLDHLQSLANPEKDWVGVAERFFGVPYVWGGRSASGLDCSALVQLARQAAGYECPRDSDMQLDMGQTVEPMAPLQRGDLIFWKGHVGIMLDPDQMIHATAYTMQVRIEPLTTAAHRIEVKEFGKIVRRARLDPIDD
ncbi:MAG: C40 family peptidase [Pseudomonadota bacterium]